MKKQLTFFTAFTFLFAAVSATFAVDETSKKAGADIEVQQQSSVINEPSGAEPANLPPDYKPVPVDASAADATNRQVSSTITISHTVTNEPNTITIVGVVDSEQQKQAALTKLREVLPGKNINNFLVVSNQTTTVSEPAGAERNTDGPEKSDNGEPEKPE